ncbi:MAG: hypothetical protein LAT62_09390 [Natronospirillum sp.]|uniref:hypothetical protein n=1 Tax=Natronospirillum sp. TaxID=2812955 RepID=UPI0025D7F008|nr:hypothetical protein [Natronospirillum sp.]MCH8552138.1 hypothetical protein [Natronospirillum sp.]
MKTEHLIKWPQGGAKSLLVALIAMGALAACNDSGSSSSSSSSDDDNGSGSDNGNGASSDFDFTIEIDAKAAADLDYTTLYSGETGQASLDSQSDAALTVDALAVGDFFRMLLIELQDEFAAESSGTHDSDTACTATGGDVNYQVTGGGPSPAVFSYDFNDYCLAMPRNFVDADGDPDGPLGDVVLNGTLEITRESDGDLTSDFWEFEGLEVAAWGQDWTLNGKKQNAGEAEVGNHRAAAIDFEVSGEAYRYHSDRGTYVDPDLILRGYIPDAGYTLATGSSIGLTATYAFRYTSDGCDSDGTNPPFADLGNVELTDEGDTELTARLGAPDTCKLYELSGTYSDGSDQAAVDIELYESILD